MLSPARLAEPPLPAVDTSRTAARSPLCRAAGWSLAALARLLAGSSVRWIASQPDTCQRNYFANHTSHLDMGLVKYALGAWGQALRPLAAKDYFFQGNPLKVAFFEHLTNLVPVDRETGSGLAFEQAKAVVQQGHVVLIFPEGTRREDGTLGAFKPLVAKLSLATGVDVLPLHLQGCYAAFPRGASLPRFGSSLRARIGPPLAATELARLTSHLGPVQAARAASEIIRAAVVALGEGNALELHRARALDDLVAARRPLVRATA